MNLDNLIKQYFSIIKKVFVWSCMVVIATEITPMKKGIVNIISFIENKTRIPFVTERSARFIYTIFRELSLIIILICIVLFLLYIVLRPILEKKNKPKLVGNFDKSFYEYLTGKNNLNTKKSYLITGDWGSGKTYLVNNFIKNNFKFSNKPIYRVSCFGLDSRDVVLQEIEKQIESQDNSIMNWVQHIPIIGLPIFSLLKKSYSIQNISSESIFIFDDFERITPLGINSKITRNSYDRKEVGNGTLNSFRRDELYEFREINDELNKVQKSLNSLVVDRDTEIMNSHLQKYNVVTGLINELVENNNSKVVVICNTNILGNNYIDKIFRGKLDCITYNKVVDKIAISNIFDSVFENYIFTSEKNKDIVLVNKDELIEDFEQLWSGNKTNNLREIKRLFQAFIETINLIDERNEVTKEIVYSLFYSIYFMMTSDDNLNGFNEMPIGSNLLFSLKEYRSFDEYNMLSESKFSSEVMWVGLPLASYWLLNMERTDDFEKSLNFINRYPYNKLEHILSTNGNLKGIDILQIKSYRLEHLKYVMKIDQKDGKSKEEELLINNFKEILPRLLVNHEIDYMEMLLMMGENNLSNTNATYGWFKIIYETTHYEARDNVDDYIFYSYKEFLNEYQENKTKNYPYR